MAQTSTPPRYQTKPPSPPQRIHTPGTAANLPPSAPPILPSSSTIPNSPVPKIVLPNRAPLSSQCVHSSLLLSQLILARVG
ncbi:hypothetical protein EJ06DRAFT_245520 [Trichodelitschia bisporula]|uniref:Uncharacterized protein n=1 Tax=Trichodelitschia bisporula TaxID=703511 RepID=A0A6G1HJB6_9PEZI|nr:hypothetical protein EJ06DRAFT_245520 [Trichodelitschia bisporula]